MITALTIAGSDSGGGAGIQADLKTFAALRVHGVSVITSLTAQNTFAVREIFDLPPAFIKAEFKALHEDFKIRAAKTGMLSTVEIIKTVASELGNYPLIVDPVMMAASGAALLKSDAIETLKEELLPKALLVTPNLPEAEILSGLKISAMKSRENMKKACKIISKYGCSVVVKGGHLNAIDMLYHKGKFYEFKAEKIPGIYHGSGCTFASAITAEIAKGNDLISAVKNAKEFIANSILNSYILGKGAKVINQLGILKDLEKFQIISALREVIKEIQENKKIARAVPQVGLNIAYALRNAKTFGEVAGISGRIIKVKNRIIPVGDIEFGGSKHVGSVVLAAMKFDSSVRCAMNIKYFKDAIKFCKKKFKISSFDRRKEPKNVSTMEWGTAEAVKKIGTVPDIIYDIGCIGKEPMIRVLGKNPREVWTKVKQILEEI